MKPRDPFGTRGSAERVTKAAKDVRVSGSALNAAVLRYGAAISGAPWNARLHFFDGTDKTVNWFLALDAVNFCFWPDPGEPRWSVFYRDQWHNGYAALASAFKRGVEEGFALWDARFLASLSEQRLRYVFRGKGTIPLFDKRVKILRETGSVLLKKFDGNFGTAVTASQGSAVTLVKCLVKNFPSFRDVAKYERFHVPFYKRAQLFVSDLHGAFHGDSFGEFCDLDVLTAFPDYKLPQFLNHLGILNYSKKLEEKIRAGQWIKAGSPMEVEIRAATVISVKSWRDNLEKLGEKITERQLDGWLWSLTQQDYKPRLPYHRTRTIYY